MINDISFTKEHIASIKNFYKNLDPFLVANIILKTKEFLNIKQMKFYI
jgi:hypothetical protein